MHAVDVMTQAFESRDGIRTQVYPGDDRHTDHVYISGRHGSTGKDSQTGTGYNTDAEAMTPQGSPCAAMEDEMELIDKIKFIKKPDVVYAADATTVAQLLASTNYDVLQTRNQMNAQFATVMTLLDPGKIADQIIAKLGTGNLTQDEITQAVKTLLYDVVLTVTTPSADDAPN